MNESKESNLPELEDGDTAVRGPHCNVAAQLVGGERGEAAVRHLYGQRGLVVLVVQVPDVHRPVHLDGEEDPRSCGRPGATSEVGVVVPCGQDGGLHGCVIRPYPAQEKGGRGVRT